MTDAPISPSHHAPELSLVVPMYNESAGLQAFFNRTVPVLEGLTRRWEIICVNDGSSDETLAHLRHYHAQDSRIRFISLSRNFGKEAALTAGLHYVEGRAVIPIDADLQDPPEVIPDLVAQWQQGYKVVLATRRERRGDTWMKKFTARVFYRLMRHLTRFEIPENTGDFRLMDIQVVEAVRNLPERTRFMKGIFAWAGFKTARVYYDREPRAEGMAKQNYFRLWQLAKDGVFSFTTLPLRITTYAGVAISLLSIGYAAVIAVKTIIRGVDVPGYASLMTAILFIGGIQLVSLGIIGEYIGRIYRETKHRPIYVIEETSV